MILRFAAALALGLFLSTAYGGTPEDAKDEAMKSWLAASVAEAEAWEVWTVAGEDAGGAAWQAELDAYEAAEAAEGEAREAAEDASDAVNADTLALTLALAEALEALADALESE